MGEIAEGILDGELCELCGVYIGEPVGHPQKCRDCVDEEEMEDDDES